MNLFVLEAFFRIFAVRGHIPGYDGRPDRPPRSSLNQNSAPLIPILAIVGATLAVLVLVVWATVSIAIKSL
jgi:hypothetical protein